MKKTILLVDDEPSLRKLIRITLDDPGYIILEASEGDAALRTAVAESPDLIILDWMLPGMSGLRVAELLKSRPATRQIPIIMLTARVEEQARKAAESLGVFGFMVKPFSPLELIRRVERALGR